MASSAYQRNRSNGRESLAAQLSAAQPVIIANNWAVPSTVEQAVNKVMAAQGALDHLGIGRFLVDNRVLSREQAQELDDILKQQQHFPEFTLLRKLGAGGMGTVFLARQADGERMVALKTINARLADDTDFIGRFHREAKALAGVKHPNIAETLGHGEHDGHCWIAMEFIDGPSLMTLLRDYRNLPELYALRITAQISAGLALLWKHAQIVHRDIKPENLLVIRSRSGGDLFPADDVAKLIDFGLAKTQEKDDRLTQTGMTIGTPLYMSPEQVRGEALDCRSDIYGLGATLYHLLTGSTPFTGPSPGAIMSAHLTEAVPDPGDRVPSLTQPTRRLVMTAMAKDPKSRFLTFDAMQAAAEAAIQDLAAKGGGTLRLLRKPLVLNKPVRKAQTDRIAKPGTTDRAAKPGSDRTTKPGSAKFGGAPAAAGDDEDPFTAAEQAAAARIGALPLDRVRTDRLAAQAAARGSSPIARPGTAPVPAGQPVSEGFKRSKVFDEDPNRQLHMGLLPWVVLGVAVLGVIAYLVFGRE